MSLSFVKTRKNGRIEDSIKGDNRICLGKGMPAKLERIAYDGFRVFSGRRGRQNPSGVVERKLRKWVGHWFWKGLQCQTMRPLKIWGSGIKAEFQEA